VPTSRITAPALLEALPDAVVVADPAGDIVYVNPAMRTLLGHDPCALRDRPITALIPERLRAVYRTGFAALVARELDDRLGTTARIPVLRADGTETAVELTLSLFDDDGEDRVVGVLRDVSANLRLERQLQISRYLDATLRLTTALAQAPDADVAFEQLLPTLCAMLDWDAATLWEPESCGGRLAHSGTWTAPGTEMPALQADTRVRTFLRGEGLPGLAWQRREPVVAEDLGEDPQTVRQDVARADGLRTAVVFPFLAGDRLLGVCELFSRTRRPVPPELLEVLASAGRQIGQFLARLRAESTLRELADTLQRSLLPAHLPVIPGVQLAARYRAGADGVLVGGDTYDVLPLPGRRWMVLIADVCGTGAEAAAITALTRHTARAAARGGPAAVLAAVNAALLHELADGPLRFVTACCLVLDPHEPGATAHVAVAGHPLPLLRHADGAVVEVGSPGRPLGIDPDVTYQEHRLDLPAGCTLVLYTDGVTEARGRDGSQFGEQALRTVVASGAGAAAAGAVAAVHAAVEGQLEGSRHGVDDLAVLAVSC
jgi:phosphoserine phosphatase RsbU/P